MKIRCHLRLPPLLPLCHPGFPSDMPFQSVKYVYDKMYQWKIFLSTWKESLIFSLWIWTGMGLFGIWVEQEASSYLDVKSAEHHWWDIVSPIQQNKQAFVTCFVIIITKVPVTKVTSWFLFHLWLGTSFTCACPIFGALPLTIVCKLVWKCASGLVWRCVRLCGRWANVCSMQEVVQFHLIWCALCKAFKVVCKVIKALWKVFEVVFEVSSMVVHQVQKAGHGGREWRSAAKDGQNHWASSNVHNHDNDEKYLIQKLLTGKYDQLREAEFSKQKKQSTMEACLMFQTSKVRSPTLSQRTR